ncbi:MAG: DNA-directed RNA polymerase subunit P [bacterium]|nr:DNA-directed RNA polymerase subunit P [bacterium]
MKRLTREQIRYRCFFCGKVYTSEEVEAMRGFCPNCGNNVFVKVRPQQPKIVKAR